MFRMDNTKGFTQDELDAINDMLDWLVDGGMNERKAVDYLDNVWTEGDTKKELLAKVSQ